MARATDIAQIVTLEAELSRRQADLEALESQLASLEDSIARSPIRISLTTDRGVIAEDPGTGFLAGLEGGWKAFTASVVVLLTAIGAVLPFAVVLAVLGLPLWWAYRRRRQASTPSSPTAPRPPPPSRAPPSSARDRPPHPGRGPSPARAAFVGCETRVREFTREQLVAVRGGLPDLPAVIRRRQR